MKLKLHYFIFILTFIVFLYSSCKEAEEQIPTPDTTNPIITLLGKNPDTLIVKTAASYNDPGATANDNIDGDISANIVVVSNLNTAIVGSYVIYYNIEDKAHNLADRKTRTIEVVKADATYDATSTCPNNMTSNISIVSYSNNDSISINDFYATGTVIKAGLNNYKYVLVPIVYSGETINGELTATGTTLNGSFSFTGPITTNCTSVFTRH